MELGAPPWWLAMLWKKFVQWVVCVLCPPDKRGRGSREVFIAIFLSRLWPPPRYVIRCLELWQWVVLLLLHYHCVKSSEQGRVIKYPKLCLFPLFLYILQVFLVPWTLAYPTGAWSTSRFHCEWCMCVSGVRLWVVYVCERCMSVSDVCVCVVYVCEWCMSVSGVRLWAVYVCELCLSVSDVCLWVVYVYKCCMSVCDKRMIRSVYCVVVIAIFSSWPWLL